MVSTPVTLLCAFSLLLSWSTDVRNETSNFVAFSVGKTSHQFCRGKVKFEMVFLNIGQGFREKLNVFIAPVAGVYQFSASGLNYMYKDRRTELFLGMYKNHEYIVSVFESSAEYAQGSISVLLLLSHGDQVFLRMRNKLSGMYGNPEQIYATFSGYLIRAT